MIIIITIAIVSTIIIIIIDVQVRCGVKVLLVEAHKKAPPAAAVALHQLKISSRRMTSIIWRWGRELLASRYLIQTHTHTHYLFMFKQSHSHPPSSFEKWATAVVCWSPPMCPGSRVSLSVGVWSRCVTKKKWLWLKRKCVSAAAASTATTTITP